MIKTFQSDLESLKDSTQFGGLYEYLQAASRDGSGTVIFSTDGTVLVREQLLRESFRKMFTVWIRTPYIRAEHLPNDELALLQKEQREQEQANAKLIQDAANQRLNALLHTDGLLEDDRNIALLKNWFDRNNAPFTSYNLDRAVEELASELLWSVWSPRVQSAVEVRTLENGEPELPIDCDPVAMRRASKAQLQDLSVRRGEFRQNRKGSFGSAFIERTF